MTKIFKLAVFSALMSASIFALAGEPFMPSFQGTAQPTHPAPLKLPNMYKMAPIPPLMPVIFRYRSELGLTAAQWESLKVSLKGNKAMMLAAMSINRTLHEDILNGVTGAPLADAQEAVQRSQTNLLDHSVKADFAIRSILSPSQMAQVVSLYRQLENQAPGMPSPASAPQGPQVNGVRY